MPPDNAQPSDAEQLPYRDIPEEELKRILADHRKWLATSYKEGKRADLQRADLNGAVLNGANLQRAKLRHANLQEAQLAGAKLQRADLRDANLQKARLGSANLQKAKLQRVKLQGADLRSANLQKVNLHEANLEGARLSNAELQGSHLTDSVFQRASLRNTNFRHTNLSDADLSNVKDFRVGNLAGAILTNARIPEDVANFEGLSHIAKTSENARKIFLGLLLGCVYAWLSIATTTDARLIANSSSSPLPIIQTNLPIAWFFWAAPLILLSVYFYLHLYLQQMWERLASLPAVFPSGESLDERAYPWLLIRLANSHVPVLRMGRRPTLSHLQNAVSILLAWWFVPVTLLAFWLRYLPRQDWMGTILLLTYVVIAAGFGMLSYLLARRALRGQNVEFSWQMPWRDGRSGVASGTVLLALILSLISYASIEAERWRRSASAGPHNWLPLACEWLGCSPYPFANLERADLDGLNLRRANFQGANLRYANFRNADLQFAKLQGADLRAANLLEALNVVQEQLDQACGNEKTQLPEGLEIRSCEFDEILPSTTVPDGVRQ